MEIKAVLRHGVRKKVKKKKMESKNEERCLDNI